MFIFSKTKKIISALIVFVIMFTYSGTTLEALATTDGLNAITNGFFGSDEIEFTSYFEESGEKINEKVGKVNEKQSIIFEVSPKEIGKGFIKEGKIIAQTEDGKELNFKFSKIKNIEVEENEEKPEIIRDEENQSIVMYDEEDNSDETIDEESEDIQEESAEEVVTEEPEQEEKTEDETNVVDTEIENEDETDSENTVEVESEEIVEEPETTNDQENIENESGNLDGITITSRAGESREETASEEQQDEYVDEEKVIEEKKEELGETYEELTAKELEIEITENNEIKIQNVINKTKIEVEIEYEQKDEINIEEIFEEIGIRVEGTYINRDLERKEVEKTEKIKLGWEYSKEIEIESEYTQVSPFKLDEHEGTIVESKVKVKRNIEDEKYLPIRKTNIEIEVPEYNGQKPATVSVQAAKLIASRGEDAGEVQFGDDNWKYEENDNKLEIEITNEDNGKAKNKSGEDEYIILYRYNTYTEDTDVELANKVKVTVEEYSAKENKITTKENNDQNKVTTTRNDLITYNIGTTDDKVNRAKINANYNVDEAKYESEFVSNVNVNILTSDVLEELKIRSTKEMYLDNNGTEFDAKQDIYYNKVRFNFNEIKPILQNGGTVEIQGENGNLLYTLTEELIQNEDDCEIKLTSKEKDIQVILRNITVNGTVGVEFTKAIEKSNYEKAIFNNFNKIKSYVVAEVKYESYEETYTMNEIAVEKEFENSQTVAEINLVNNYLSTTSKNNDVEMRISLNNDKQNTDLYVNPSFELVFPKSVTNVIVKDIDMIYAEGLQIEGFDTYKENDIVKMRIDLKGKQTEFSNSILTNGTNILINVDLELNEYTSRKQDEIKMYYCNEGVTNYESQTQWTMNKGIPNGIVKQTNGFDAEIVNYQAPSGFITANAIINYDGQASKIKSVMQGDKTEEIKAKSKEQIATMELVGINNTGNKCTDGVFIGSIAFKGNRSVVTGEKLGTTETVKMLGGLRENIENINMSDIYYTENEKATKDLNNQENGWTKDVEDWSKIKKYMIITKGEIKDGTILKYTYDFEIPENLDYEEKLYGSFGGFYNNNGKDMIKYESTEADKVGLKTQVSPEIKVTVEPYGENKTLHYGQIVRLVAKVENYSNEVLENSTLKVSIPTETVYTELQYNIHEDGIGIYEEYIDNPEMKEINFNIENLAIGESQSFEFDVRISDSEKDKNTLQGSTEINGNIQDYQIIAKKAEMKVNVISGEYGATLHNNSKIQYYINIENLSNTTIKDLMMTFNISDYLKINSIKVLDKETDTTEDDVRYIIESRKVQVDIGDLDTKGKFIVVSCKIEKLDVEQLTLKTIFNIYKKDNEKEKYSSNLKTINVEKIPVLAKQSLDKSEYNYGDEFEYIVNVKNTGKTEKLIRVIPELAECMMINEAKIMDDNQEYEIISNNEIYYFRKLLPNSSMSILIKGKIIDVHNENLELNLPISVTVKGTEEDIKVDDIILRVNKKIEENTENQNDEDIYYNDDTDDVDIRRKTTLEGTVFVDSNLNGVQDADEQGVDSQVEVQLLKDSTMVKAVTTDSNGNYKFDELEEGNYSVVYNYNKDEYSSVEHTEENNNLKTVEIKEGTAVTDTINVGGNPVETVKTGLQEKDKFDLKLTQYISKIIANIDGEEKEYDYSDATLAKLEIEPSKLDKTNLKFVYKLKVENVGNITGQVSSIVDYVPNGMSFAEQENENWSVGTTEGNVYYDGLKDVNIEPGESEEITLILNKKMTEDNTGVISNKAKIAYTESDTRLVEAEENNFATQETIITVTQGLSRQNVIIITISIVAIVSIFAYMIQTGKLQISLNLEKGIKKIYK